MVELIEAGVLAALMAWVLTQFHLILTARRINRRLQDGRQRTEAFVARELARLESSYVQHTKSLTERVSEIQAGIPEAGNVRLEHIETRFDQLIDDLKHRFEGLPADLEFRLRQAQGRETMEMMKVAKENAGAMRTELAALEAQIPPEALAAQGDFRAKILKAITREPTAKELKGMGMIGETIWNAGRAYIAERILGAQGMSPGGDSATYTVTRKSPYGL